MPTEKFFNKILATMSKQTGQIKRIKNGNWQIRAQWREKGARKTVSHAGYKSQDDAKEALKVLLGKIKKAQTHPQTERKTFNQLFDAYLEIIKPNIREQTYDLYERIIRTHLKSEFGEMNVTALDPLTIERYYVRLQKTLAGETIFKIHNQLKSALKKARTWKWITENPIEDIKPPKRIKNPVDPLTPEELARFFEACPSQSVRTQWIFFALTGARAQEVFGAKWKDIDFERKIFNVTQVLVRLKGKKKFAPPKTDSSRRKIPLSDDLLQMLRKHKVEQNIGRLKLGDRWNDNDLVFPTATGKPQSLNNIGLKVRKIKTDAKIDKAVTPHLFRHSFATISRRNGNDLKVISEYLGHSSIKITGDIYSHVNMDEKRQMSNAMSDIILQK